MRSKHFIERCRYCDKVIRQCRCTGEKAIEYGTCDDCKGKDTPKAHFTIPHDYLRKHVQKYTEDMISELEKKVIPGDQICALALGLDQHFKEMQAICEEHGLKENASLGEMKEWLKNSLGRLKTDVFSDREKKR
jgi:hypothetical protein